MAVTAMPPGTWRRRARASRCLCGAPERPGKRPASTVFPVTGEDPARGRCSRGGGAAVPGPRPFREGQEAEATGRQGTRGGRLGPEGRWGRDTTAESNLHAAHTLSFPVSAWCMRAALPRDRRWQAPVTPGEVAVPHRTTAESETPAACAVGKPHFSQGHAVAVTGQLAGQAGDTAPVRVPVRSSLSGLKAPGEAWFLPFSDFVKPARAQEELLQQDFFRVASC